MVLLYETYGGKMKFHDQLLKDITATYSYLSHESDDQTQCNTVPVNYEILCAKHKVLINSIKDELYSVAEQLPTFGSHVLVVEDLSPIGKGIFLTDLWYNKHGFVSEECADDAYGYVTHWTYLRLENE